MKTMGEAAGSLGGEKKAAPADAKPKPNAKKLRTGEMHIRRGAAGGYIVKNHLEDEDGNMQGRPQEYPMQSLNQVVKHLRVHMPSGASAAASKGETPTNDPENC